MSRTSEMPESAVKSGRSFTKDTLEGDYKGFRREIWSRGAYESSSHSVGSVNLYFVLVGEHSAITAGIYTDFYLPETIERWEESGIDSLRPHGMGGIVDFHWDFPIEGAEARDDCTLIEGKCWSISTLTLDEQMVEALAREGFAGVWHDLYEILTDQTKVQQESD